MAENRNTYTIKDDGDVSTVKIADEVVAVIAGLAATEVKGVDSLAGNVTADVIPKKGGKSISKCVPVSVNEGKVSCDLAITIAFGHSIPEVSRAVQERVKSAIENMTGMEVTEINISVAGVGAEEN